MSAKPFTMRSIVPSTPPRDEKTFLEQQGASSAAFTGMQQFIWSGLIINQTLTRIISKRAYITYFQFSIKGAPDAEPEIQLYWYTKNDRQLVRHCMPRYAWHTGQTIADQEYESKTYNFIPPIILDPASPTDYLAVKCDGGSTGHFCVIGYEEPHNNK